MRHHRFISLLGLVSALVTSACSLLDVADTDSDRPPTSAGESGDSPAASDDTSSSPSPETSTSGSAATETGSTGAPQTTGTQDDDASSSEPAADTGASTGELSCDEIEVAPVEPADRRLGIGYLFLQGAVGDVGLAARSLCLGDCLNIQDIDVRSLCLAMVTGDACNCEVIVDYTLRNVCQGSCEAIGMDADMRNFCLGDEACELLQDHDMRSFCMGDCGLIPGDPNFRYLCEGACNLIN